MKWRAPFLTLFTLLLLFISSLMGKTLYVEVGGSEEGPGDSELRAFGSLEKALEAADPGDRIVLGGGTYQMAQTLVIEKSGTAESPIEIFAAPGDSPVFNFSAQAEDPSNRGIVLNADYIHLKGVIIEEAGDNGMLLSGHHNIVEDCVFRKNRDSGLQLSRFNTDFDNIEDWPSYNLILGCESYDNKDSDNEDADGFAPKLTTGEGNVFRDCVAHHNIDDGWDLYAKADTGPIGIVTLENCIAHNNGTLTDGVTSGGGDKNGFKLGSSDILVPHKVIRCIAFNNGKHGFTDNGNISAILFLNNTSYANGDYNFHTRDDASHIFINNISLEGNHTDRIVGNINAPNALTDTDTNWPFTAGADDFISLSPGPNNDPLQGGFLALSPQSPLLDAGNVSDGLLFAGDAPDLGAVEAGLEIPTSVSLEKIDTRGLSVTSGPKGLLVKVIESGPHEIYLYDMLGNRVAGRSSKSTANHLFSEVTGAGYYILKYSRGNTSSFARVYR